MYESPKELVREFAPIPVVSYTPVARAAGVLYLLSIVVPLLSERLSFAQYTAAFTNEPQSLVLPFSGELTIIAAGGTLVGPAETYGSAGGGAEGLALALADVFISPTLIIGLPLTGIVLTILPLVLAAVLLTGYKRHIKLMSIGFMMVIFTYSAMMSLKTATLHPHVGLILMGIATGLIFFLAFDRIHQIGFVAGNRYPLPLDVDDENNKHKDSEKVVNYAGSAKRSEYDDR